MKQTLYLPSTALNLIICCAHAIQNKSDDSRLWLIDQSSSNIFYLDLLKKWSHSPFKDVQIFFGDKKGLMKLQQRKKIFKTIKKQLDFFLPTDIFVGSDRRIEFQYIHHILKAKGLNFTCHYLDDGLYSYLDFPIKFLQHYTNSLLKKIIYGRWYEHPKNVGSSNKINSAWLFHPNLSNNNFLSKVKIQIPIEIFKNLIMLELCQLFLQQYKTNQVFFDEMDILILLPHPVNMEKTKNYEKNILELVQGLKISGKNIGIKYHPRHLGDDPLGFETLGINKFIPAKAGIEFILPILKKETFIIGDFTSALLTCKWLRPDIKSIAFSMGEHPMQKEFSVLLNGLGIPSASSIKEVIWSQNV